MIGKQIKGTRFRGCLDYVLGKKGAYVIGGTMCGQTPEELATEFGITRQLRPNLKVAVFHATLSVDATEKLDSDAANDQRWCAIADDYMKAMGFDNNQYVVVKHTDTQHDHIHIVGSRISVDGTVVDDSWDYYKSQAVIRSLEYNYNLERITPSWECDRRAQTTGEYRKNRSTGQKSVRVQLQALIDECAHDQPTMPELISRLQQQDALLPVLFTRTGFVKGISYQLNGIAFSGTQLGKAYTFQGLQQHRGVSYDPERDNPQIEILLQQQPEIRTQPLDLTDKFLPETDTETDLIETVENQVSVTQGKHKALNPSDEQALPQSHESQWQKVRKELHLEYQLPLELLDLLHERDWMYADGKGQAVFTGRRFDGEPVQAFVLDEWGNFSATSPIADSAFWVAETGEIERAVITASPIAALSILLIEMEKSWEETKPTAYLAIEQASQLPHQLLQKFDDVIVALEADSQVAQDVMALLPNAQLGNPNQSWNGRGLDIGLELERKEQQQLKPEIELD